MRLIDADALRIRILTTTFTESNMWALKLMIGLIDDVPTVGGWISIKDRMPDYMKDVLVCNDDGRMCVGRRNKGSTHPMEWEIKYIMYDYDSWDDSENGPVMYWMPLPEPPEGVEE